MAESFNTLAGLVQFNDKNLADLNVTDLLEDAPVLQKLHAQEASDKTIHYYLKQTTASTAAFRDALDAVAKTASADTKVTCTLKILDGSFDTDVALADAYKGGRDAWLQLELVRKMKQVFATAEKQVFYGTGADAKGFAGILDGLITALSNAMCVNAAGSTASVQTSCYLLRSGRDDASFIMGNGGQIVVEDEPTVIAKAGAVLTSSTYPALYVPVTGYAGFQYGGTYSIARIANIDTNSLTSSTAFTDVHLMNALARFPGSRRPNMICMNRNAQLLLWNSRSAYSPTGAPAALPVDFMGIPFIITDQILSTEAVET